MGVHRRPRNTRAREGHSRARVRRRAGGLFGSAREASENGRLVAPGQPESEDLSLPRIQAPGCNGRYRRQLGKPRELLSRKLLGKPQRRECNKRLAVSHHALVKRPLTLGQVRVNFRIVR